MGARPADAPEREARRDLDASLEELDRQERQRRTSGLGGLGGAGFGAIAGSPATVREYMDEYLETGANYFVCSFQWGDLSHDQAMQSLELFAAEVMPHYVGSDDNDSQA